jgi:hypothetical protein
VARTLREAVEQIVVDRLRSEVTPLVRSVVSEILAQELGIELRRRPGRPPKAAATVSGEIARTRRRRGGRRRQFTDEQRRQRAADYQRQYRLRKKAEAPKARGKK